MTARDLLLELHAKGVEVKTSGDDRLVIDAPKGTITEDLRNALSANKAELLNILKAEQTKPAEVAVSEVPEPVPDPQLDIPAAPPLTSAPEVMSHVAEEPSFGAPRAMPPVKQAEEAPVAASPADENAAATSTAAGTVSSAHQECTMPSAAMTAKKQVAESVLRSTDAVISPTAMSPTRIGVVTIAL